MKIRSHKEYKRIRNAQKRVANRFGMTRNQSRRTQRRFGIKGL